MVPRELTLIKDVIIKQNIILTKLNKDARTDSAQNEQEILNVIKGRRWDFEVIEPEIRNWFDFAVKTNSDFLPVNIKVSDTTHADNLNCKLGIYYTLTGKIPKFSNEIGWESFFKALKEDIGKDKSKDYYFLVFNKNNNQDVFVNTLKGLKKLQPNGNNLPFQCKWSENREFQERDFNDAKKFLLDTFGLSIKLRAKIYLSFKEQFSEHV